MKKFGKVLSLLLAVAMIVSVFAACGNKPAETSSSSTSSSTSGSTGSGSDSSTGSSATGGFTGTIKKNKLALIAPLTGNNMQYGVAYKNSCEMAIDLFNKDGGVNGVMIEFETHDDKGDQKEAINLANKVASDDTVFAIVGSFGSSLSMAIAPVVEQYQIPFFSPNVSHPEFPKMSKMIVSLSATQYEEQTQNAKILDEDFGKPKLGIMYQNTDNGVSASTNLENYYKERGGEVVAKETFTPGGQTKDFTPMLSKIKAAGAEWVFISADYADAAQILIQRLQVGMEDVKFLCQGQVIKTEFMELIGDRADGLIMTGGMSFMGNLVSQYDKQIQDYITEYNKRYGEGKCDGFAANGYDCANFALYALREVGDADPLAICDQARKLECPIVVSGNRSDFKYQDDNVFLKGVFTYVMNGAEVEVYKKA